MKNDVKNFWRFVHERMSIYKKRAAGEPKPWTDDPVLRDNFFTNVFRELDPGTVVAQEIMSAHSPAWVRAWNLLLYRRLNREETWAKIGFMKKPNHGRVLAALRTIEGPIFTGAHQVNMLQMYPRLGRDPITRQANMMANTDWIKEWAKEISHSATAETAFKVTLGMSIPGVGGFLAWQLVLDLRYGGEPIGLYSDDEWAPVQAGAKAGLLEVYGVDSMPKDEMQDCLSDMVYDQENEFGQQDLNFNEVSDDRLTYAAVEHSLCEYAKYVRIARGGHAKGKFDGR